MMQLQFKFDPLPTESAEICLFHERWIKTFDTQPFCQLCIKYVLIFYKNDLVQFCNKYMVGPSQKNSFRALEKWKMNFPCKENALFGIPRCTLVHNMRSFETNYAMNVAIRLIIWLESHESSRMIAHF